MSNLELPRFNFSSATIKTEDELAALEATQGKKGDKYLSKPGKYEVVIQTIEVTGPATSDPTWHKVRFTYMDAGERTIRDTVMVPTTDLVYGEKKTLFPFKKLQRFTGALGYELTASNVGEIMKTVFGQLKKLEGRPVSIEVGYQSAYIKYMGKDGEASVYNIIDRDGNPVRDAELNAVKFPDVDSAKNYAASASIQLGFANVLAYEKSAAGVAAQPVAASW